MPLCSRCGRAPRCQEVPVREVLIPFILAVTRRRPVPAEIGWVDLMTAEGDISLCPECAAKPALMHNPDEDPDEDLS